MFATFTKFNVKFLKDSKMYGTPAEKIFEKIILNLKNITSIGSFRDEVALTFLNDEARVAKMNKFSCEDFSVIITNSEVKYVVLCSFGDLSALLKNNGLYSGDNLSYIPNKKLLLG